MGNRFNKKEFFQMVNFYLIWKYCGVDSKEGKSVLESFKAGSPYTCCSCKMKSGLSFLEPKHDCRSPMFDTNHIPNGDYLKKKVSELGYSWDKLIKHFEGLMKIKLNLLN